VNAALLKKLKELKEKYQPEGFEIVGLFGSVARSEETETSDLDIAYRIESIFLSRFRGFDAFARLEEIKEEMETFLGKNVDLAPVDSTSRTFQNVLKRDLVNV